MTEFLQVTSFDPLIVTANVAGPTGPAGATGPAGSPGADGATGATGPAGTGANPTYDTLANRPSAASAGDKTLYFATDSNGGTLFQVQSGAWAEVARGVTETLPESQITNLTADLAAKLVKASNLSDLASASTARTNLGLGTAAVANKVAAGSAGVLDATDATTTNSRTPTAHHTSHESGGGDVVSLAASQIASGTIATARLGSGTANGAAFLRGDQTWATPGAFPTNYMAPTGALYETVPRQQVGTTPTAVTTGVLYLVGIQLPAGVTIGHIEWFTAQSVFSTTHQWFTLHDSSRVMLAATADATSAGYSANTFMSLPIATIASGASTTFTTTYTGLHYLGIMFAIGGGQGPSLIGPSGSGNVYNLAPILAGTSNSAQTTPPAFPFTASALAGFNSIPYGYVAA